MSAGNGPGYGSERPLTASAPHHKLVVLVRSNRRLASDLT